VSKPDRGLMQADRDRNACGFQSGDASKNCVEGLLDGRDLRGGVRHGWFAPKLWTVYIVHSVVRGDPPARPDWAQG
jgi:hypothetical protein